MQAKKYQIFTGPRLYNIIYVEGLNADSTLNADRPNEFNDRRIVLEIVDVPRILGNWEATTEPGDYYTIHPMNAKGAARIAFGQYEAWQVGYHGHRDTHEALIQVAPIKVYRDYNKDYKRTGDFLDTGLFGVNQHWGYDMPVTKVYNASAGCLVGRGRESHKQFMKIIKGDRRYAANPKYIFWTAIVPGDELIKQFPIKS
jgi:hypothetical protein